MKPYLYLHIPKTGGTSIVNFLPSGRCTVKDFFTNNKDNNDLVEYGFHGPRHHFTLEQHKKIGLDKIKQFDELYKFTFVRNPWDRIVSIFHHWKRFNTKIDTFRSKATGEITSTTKIEFSDDAFSSFVHSTLFDAMQSDITEYKPKIMWEGKKIKGIFNQPVRGCPFYYTTQYGHFTPQVKYTHTATGEQLVDFIGKYETLQEDLTKLSEILDLGLLSTIVSHHNKSERLKKDYRSYYNDGSGLAKRLVYEIYREDIETYGYAF